MTGRIICIVGSHPLSYYRAHVQEPSVEIWAANESGVNLMPARIFQIHPRDWREEERRFLNRGVLPPHVEPDCFGRNQAHVRQLRTCGVPVYAAQHWDDIPTSLPYPFDQVREALGEPLYLTNTFAFMLALALTEHKAGQAVAEIRLAGVELAIGTPRERVWEYPCVTYYLGLARGLGITVSLPEPTSLLNAPLYAFESPFSLDDPDHWWSPLGLLHVTEDGVIIRRSPAIVA